MWAITLEWERRWSPRVCDRERCLQHRHGLRRRNDEQSVSAVLLAGGNPSPPSRVRRWSLLSRLPRKTMCNQGVSQGRGDRGCRYMTPGRSGPFSYPMPDKQLLVYPVGILEPVVFRAGGVEGRSSCLFATGGGAPAACAGGRTRKGEGGHRSHSSGISGRAIGARDGRLGRVGCGHACASNETPALQLIESWPDAPGGRTKAHHECCRGFPLP